MRDVVRAVGEHLGRVVELELARAVLEQSGLCGSPVCFSNASTCGSVPRRPMNAGSKLPSQERSRARVSRPGSTDTNSTRTLAWSAAGSIFDRHRRVGHRQRAHVRAVRVAEVEQRDDALGVGLDVVRLAVVGRQRARRLGHRGDDVALVLAGVDQHHARAVAVAAVAVAAVLLAHPLAVAATRAATAEAASSRARLGAAERGRVTRSPDHAPDAQT